MSPSPHDPAAGGAAVSAPPATPNGPYVGPRAFQAGERLYGRDREVRQLFNLLMAQRIVLLYSPSGAGKTSLIQAALIPLLEREGLKVWPVVRVTDPAGLERRDGLVANPYLASTLARIERRPDPDSPTEAPAARDLQTYLAEPAEPEVLIFDQFEEILTADPTDQAAKAEFFTQVGAALHSRQRWALFAMREDYIAGLDPYLHLIPTALSTTFRLDLLGRAAARQAVQRPAERFGVAFTDAAAQKLVEDLSRVRVQRPDGSTDEQLGPHVEPVQLQVVCRRLWERRDPAAKEIRPDDIEDIGDVDSALAGYYAERVAVIADELGASERAIREWVQRYLITPQGLRGLVLQEPERSQGLDNSVIQRLEDDHLVRADRRRGATWFELAHDRLVRPLQANNASWFTANLSPLQAQAELWERQRRPDDLLLHGEALQEAERWAARHAEELIGTETDFLRASRAGEDARQREREHREALAAEQQRAAERLRRHRSRLLVLSVVALGGAILAAVFGVQAGQQGRRAEEQAGIAAERARIATSLQLAAQARSLPTDQYHLALLLGAEAYSSFPTFEARSSLYTLLMSEPESALLLRRHTDAVNAVAFNRHGARMASAGADRQVILWDLTRERPTGRPLSGPGHATAVSSVAFSPDGKTIASGGNDGTLILWDADTQQQVGSMSTGRGAPVSSIVFTDDNESLISASGDGTLIRWDRTTLGPHPLGQAFPRSAGSSVAGLTLSPDGKTLALGDSDGALLLWDVDAGRPLRSPILGEQRALTTLTFSPDGRTLAAGSRLGAVELWDVATGETRGRRLSSGHTDVVTSAAFSPDGELLATGSRDGALYVWDVTSGLPLGSRSGSRGGVTSLVFSPDGLKLAAGNRDGVLVLRDVAAGGLQPLGQTLVDSQASVAGLAFSRDGKLVASIGEDRILFWDAESRQRLDPPLTDEAAGVLSLAFSPDGAWLVGGRADNALVIWDVAARRPLGSPLVGHSEAVASVAFSPDGKTILSGGGDGLLLLWDAHARRRLDPPLAGHTGAVLSATFSPDGKTMASGGSDGILLWDLAARSSERLRRDQTFSDRIGTVSVQGLAFSPDGAKLAAGGSDGALVIWDVAARQPLGRALVEPGARAPEVASVVFSPDGQTLASGHGDGTLILWGADSHQRLGPPLTGHLAAVTGAVFSPDGRTLAAASSARPLILWDVDPSSWRARACTLAGRNLSKQEWEQHFPGQPQRETCPDLPEEPTTSAGDPAQQELSSGERSEGRTTR